MRVRGLKFLYAHFLPPFSKVAPHAGAWIEILYVCNSVPSAVSHPMRVRGLKSISTKTYTGIYASSHPMRVRGLKFCMLNVNIFHKRVAPHAGAWIEIIVPSSSATDTESRTPCGCVD